MHRSFSWRIVISVVWWKLDTHCKTFLIPIFLSPILWYWSVVKRTLDQQTLLAFFEAFLNNFKRSAPQSRTLESEIWVAQLGRPAHFHQYHIWEFFLFNGQSIGKYFKSTLMKPKSLYRKANISVGIKFPRPRNIVFADFDPTFHFYYTILFRRFGKYISGRGQSEKRSHCQNFVTNPSFLVKIPWKGKLTLTFVRRGFFISTVATVVDLGGAWNHPQCCESGWARIVLLFPWGHWLKGAVLLKIIPTDNFSESDKRDWEVLPSGASCSHWVEGKDWEQRLRSSSSLSAPGSRKLFRNGRFQFQLSGGN